MMWRTMILLGLLAGAAPAAAGVEHGLDQEAVEQRVKRWSALEPFRRWRVVEAALADRVSDGVVRLTLLLAPPVDWSAHGLAYRTELVVCIDAASRAPVRPEPRAWRARAAAIEELIGHVECYENVRRFIERFGAERARITPVVGAGGEPAYRVTFVGAAAAGQPDAPHPELTFDRAAADPVVAYHIPRMDSLPVRRELLRLVEGLSGRHPGCRPRWLSAAQCPPAVEPEDGTAVAWRFDFELVGPGCPAAGSARLEPGGQLRWLDAAGQAAARAGD